MDLFPGEPAFPDQELRKPPAHGEYPFTLPVLLQLSRRPAFQRLLRHLIILAVPIAHRIFPLQPQNCGNGKILIEIGCQMRSRRPAAKLKHRHFSSVLCRCLHAAYLPDSRSRSRRIGPGGSPFFLCSLRSICGTEDPKVPDPAPADKAPWPVAGTRPFRTRFSFYLCTTGIYTVLPS